MTFIDKKCFKCSKQFQAKQRITHGKSRGHESYCSPCGAKDRSDRRMATLANLDAHCALCQSSINKMCYFCRKFRPFKQFNHRTPKNKSTSLNDQHIVTCSCCMLLSINARWLIWGRFQSTDPY